MTIPLSTLLGEAIDALQALQKHKLTPAVRANADRCMLKMQAALKECGPVDIFNTDAKDEHGTHNNNWMVNITSDDGPVSAGIAKKAIALAGWKFALWDGKPYNWRGIAPSAIVELDEATHDAACAILNLGGGSLNPVTVTYHGRAITLEIPL